jgi:hypothetical protein
MEFFKFVTDVKKEYASDSIIRENKTILLAPGKLPKCKYMFFEALSQDLIDDFLVSHFSGITLPEDYIEVLKTTNGANLFSVKINSGKVSFANSMLVILGLPRTRPFGRPLDMEEPFDIRVENLARHKNIPVHWLKCAIWTQIEDVEKGDNQTDIFIDTITKKVFACRKNQEEILKEWSTLDESLCYIIDSFKELKDEYELKI